MLLSTSCIPSSCLDASFDLPPPPGTWESWAAAAAASGPATGHCRTQPCCCELAAGDQHSTRRLRASGRSLLLPWQAACSHGLTPGTPACRGGGHAAPVPQQLAPSGGLPVGPHHPTACCSSSTPPRHRGRPGRLQQSCCSSRSCCRCCHPTHKPCRFQPRPSSSRIRCCLSCPGSSSSSRQSPVRLAAAAADRRCPSPDRGSCTLTAASLALQNPGLRPAAAAKLHRRASRTPNYDQAPATKPC